MAINTVRTISPPGRGDVIPDLHGTNPAGDSISTRDFYMRRNLAIIFLPHVDGKHAWIAEAESQRSAAQREDGEILLVVGASGTSSELPTMLDPDGSRAARFGLTPADLPAIFVINRYGTVFAATHGEHARPDLRPRDIPGWLEFIACRCS